MVMKNKRGWIEIVESFSGILLIAVILIIIISGSQRERPDTSLQIYDSEYAILRDVQLSPEFRDDILGVSTLPVQWVNFGNANNLDGVKKRIISNIPAYLDCEAKICSLNDACTMDSVVAGKNIYVQSAMISANANGYNPRKLKLFCWEK